MLSAHNALRLIFVLTSSLVLSTNPAAAQQPFGINSITNGSSYVTRSFSPKHVQIAAEARRAEANQASSDYLQQDREIELTSFAEQVSNLDEVVEEFEGESIDSGTVIDESCSSCEPCLSSHGWGPQILPGFWVDHLSLLGGVHAFKNAGNRGEDGSFGFHYGLNYGTAAKNIILPPTIGWQAGFQLANSNLNGASFTQEDRNQAFVTLGLFRRGDCGLQGGVVFDYMRDDWYYDTDVTQIRGELSLAITPAKSLGFRFAKSLDEDTVVATTTAGTESITWTTEDQYRFFYRTRMLACGTGESQVFAGFTGQSDGLIGAITRLPLHNGWAIETDWTYLIPSESKQNGANDEEAWNVALNLVWYPGSLACGSCYRYHRPMFDVANNGSMMLRRTNNP